MDRYSERITSILEHPIQVDSYMGSLSRRKCTPLAYSSLPPFYCAQQEGPRMDDHLGLITTTQYKAGIEKSTVKCGRSRRLMKLSRENLNSSNNPLALQGD